MLLVIDAGNTNVKFGIYDGQCLRYQWRIRTEPGRTADEYAALLYTLFAQAALPFDSIHGIAFASVVPALTPHLRQLAKHTFHCDPVQVSGGAEIGLEIRYQPAGDVGADRLADAAAAVDKYGAPCIVIDFGTATTFNAIISPETPGGLPIYLGGAICLGIGVSLDALFARAAQISRVTLAKPPCAIGSNTIHALQSGIIFGYVAQVQGMVERFRREMSAPECPVIATGGHAAGLVAAESALITAVEPLLTLEGLRLIYHRNRPGA